MIHSALPGSVADESQSGDASVVPGQVPAECDGTRYWIQRCLVMTKAGRCVVNCALPGLDAPRPDGAVPSRLVVRCPRIHVVPFPNHIDHTTVYDAVWLLT
jgi:hypothetical protein